jgi:hypothetical protein
MITMEYKDQLGYKSRGKSRKSKRPPFITAVCIALFALGIFNIVYTFTGLYQGLNTLYPAVNALMIVFSFVGLSGVWAMEKWGPISFAIVVVLKVLVDLIFSNFQWYILLGFIPAVLFLLALPKMKNTD